MEPVVGALQGLNTGSSNFLGLPEPCPWDSDDELLAIGGIKPKSSPIPRRRSSSPCSDDDSQPPPSSSRRVSFADAFGLSLVSVKQFQTWSMCDSADPLEVDLMDAKEYFLNFLFAPPVSLEELLYKVQEQKVELENLELLPGTTTLKGTVRVLNLCFDKLVYVRTSLDCWSSHFDLLAEYVPESSNGITDCFSFKLTLVPPFGDEGARVDFCIRFETPFGSFWANNNGQNYALFCHEKAKDQDENDKKPKSCLKLSRHSSMTSTTSDAEESPEIILNCGITTVVERVGAKEEKTQEERMKLKEDNDRNSSRKNRRKSARMAKIQQYFAQRDEKDLQQSEKDTDEVAVLVPAIDEAPLNLSAPQTNGASLLPEPEKSKGQKSIAGFTDVDRHQFPASQTHTQEKDNIPVIQPKLMTSKSQTRQAPLDSVNSHKSVEESQLLPSRHDQETITSQTVSLKCQTSDKSIGTSVEKAWECFEKSAMGRIGSIADTYSSVGKTDHVDNTVFENDHDPQSCAPHYTFETIVAPLYHQVFARMENDRRASKNSTLEADESVGKLDDGCLKVITHPSVQTRSNPEISAELANDADYHGACKGTVPECLHSAPSATENVLSVPNVKTEIAAEIAFQDTALADGRSDAYISESKAARVVTEKQQTASNIVPSVYWEGSTTGQTEQTPGAIVSQSECLDDTECSLDYTPPYSGFSLNSYQQDRTCTASSISQTQSEVDITTAKHLPGIVSENPQPEDRSASQTSFHIQVSDEISTVQHKKGQISEKPNTDIKCQDETCPPMPGSTSFHSDMSSNGAPKTTHSVSLPPSQGLTQATLRPQIPPTVFFTLSPEATATTVDTIEEVQTTVNANVIQNTITKSHDSDHAPQVIDETESNPNCRNVTADSGEDTEKDIQTKRSHTSSDDTGKESISQNFMHVKQVNEKDEHRISRFNLSDEVTDCDERWGKDMEVSNISSNPEEQGEEQERVQVKDPVKNEEQEVTGMAENQLEEGKGIREVEKRLEEEKEGRQQVEKEEQGADGKREYKFKDGPFYTDVEEDVKKGDMKKEAAPRRNEMEREQEKRNEEGIEEQEMVGGITAVATLQSLPNMDTFIGEVQRQERQNTSVEPMSEETVRERHFIGQEEDVFCGTKSSQQALTQNSDVAVNDSGEEVNNNAESVDHEEDAFHQTDQEHVAEYVANKTEALAEKQTKDCLKEQSENVDDSTSTESLTDDEMELYLLRLKNTQQSGLQDMISKGKRHSVSRTCTIPSPMPSISEYTDEDQPNALLDDLANEPTTELESDTSLPPLDEEEECVDPNLLWWREFFSSANMPKMIVYTLLLVVFLITTYVCDFIACFGLYLLALYWLYFQVHREPIKGN